MKKSFILVPSVIGLTLMGLESILVVAKKEAADARDYWRKDIQIRSGNLHSPTLGQYYYTNLSLVKRPHLISKKWILDEKGIPATSYPKMKPAYNPVHIAQYGLLNFDLYSTQLSQTHLSNFLRATTWLRDNLVVYNSIGLWFYNFSNPWAPFKEHHWISGLAQGQGISALLRAYQVTNDESFLNSAKYALGSFFLSIDLGGVKCLDKENVWFEEHISKPPTHILNGHMIALLGIFDFFRVTGDTEAEKLFDLGLQTILQNLLDYDSGFWSYYDSPTSGWSGIAPPTYHNLHILLLHILYNITENVVFLNVAQRWDKYQFAPSCLILEYITRKKRSIKRRLVNWKLLSPTHLPASPWNSQILPNQIAHTKQSQFNANSNYHLCA